jgi:DNA-binding NtrC family response regulator
VAPPSVELVREPALLSDRSILIVDDHDGQRHLLERYLGDQGSRCVGARGGQEALARMGERKFDLVLLDLRMDDLDGMQVLQQARAQGLADRFVMMSAEGTIAHAVEAIRLGASDFLVKPFDVATLASTLERVLGASERAMEDPRLSWREEHAPELRGTHPALRDVLLVCERIAPTDCTVLLSGESGTGKELVARAIHRASARAHGPFVPVNCGAIPETLIESELFGHARGAFSGATQSREGRFAAADGGTLFLDEIAEMSLAVQVKFLRVVQEQEFVPVGETRPRRCNVRIIAATNRDLGRMAKTGAFREDLFYRLNSIPIDLPPLRVRSSDIPQLCRHFLHRVGERSGVSVREISASALERLCAHAWPGNVRELEHVIERMALLHRGHGVLDVADLPEEIRRKHTTAPWPAVVVDPEPQPAAAVAMPTLAVAPALAPRGWAPDDLALPEAGMDLREALRVLEYSLIDQALARTGGNRNRAAALLGLRRTTLVEKLKKRGS